jgi:hypothetical protein
VRCLSTDTLLNGQTFREQTLRPGDRLRTGPIEFEVLGDPSRTVLRGKRSEYQASSGSAIEIAPWTHAESSRPAEFLARIERIERQLDSIQMPLAPLPPAKGEVVSADAPSPLPAVESPAVPRQFEAECERLDAERIRLEKALSEKADHWAETRRLFDERLQEWETLHRQAESEVSRLREELERQQSELTGVTRSLGAEIQGLAHDLQAEREQLQSAQQTWAASRAALEAESRATRDRCAELEQLLLAKRDELEQERRRWDGEQTALQSQLAANQARCAELEQQVKRLTEECDQLAARLRDLPAPGQTVSSPKNDAIPVPTTDSATPPRESTGEAPNGGRTPGDSRRPELLWLAQRWAAAGENPTAPTEPSAGGLDADPLHPHPNCGPSEPDPIASGESCAQGREAGESRSASITEANADPCTDATFDEAYQESNVLERLQRAGIWRHSDSLPSAFDAATDDPQPGIEPDCGPALTDRSPASDPAEYERVEDDRESDPNGVITSTGARTESTLEALEGEADDTECREGGNRVDPTLPAKTMRSRRTCNGSSAA